MPICGSLLSPKIFLFFFNIFIDTQETNKKKYIKIDSIQNKKTIYIAYNVQVKLRYKVYELLYF